MNKDGVSLENFASSSIFAEAWEIFFVSKSIVSWKIGFFLEHLKILQRKELIHKRMEFLIFAIPHNNNNEESTSKYSKYSNLI